MPQTPSLPTASRASGVTLWCDSDAASSLGNLDGATFDEAGLRAMRRALDDVCGEVAPRAAPAEREFIAWLIVRLSCSGMKDGLRLRSAALAALSRRKPHAVAV